MKDLTPIEAIQLVTPDMAQHWVTELNYDRQRNISFLHVKILTEEMVAGRFRQKTQISFVRVKGRLYLVNGQHTLTAIVKSGIPQMLAITITDAEDMEALADEYSRHDVGRQRRGSDALFAHRMDEELGVSATVLQWVTAAALVYAYALGEITAKEQTRISHDKKLLILRRHGPLIVKATTETGLSWSNKALHWARRKNLLATLTFTYSRRPEDAIAFWGGMFADDGLAAGDPRKVLLKEYEQSTLGGGFNRYTGATRTMLTSDIPLLAAGAWNAFMERRSITYLRLNDRTKRSVSFKGCGEMLI